MNSDLLEVAVLGKSVGLKGFLKLHDKSDFPDQFKKNAKFFDKFGKEFVLKSFNRANSTALFEGYESIELAKALTNTILYSTKDATRQNCKLKKDEYFYFDIIGLEVFENGEFLGEVVDIEDGVSPYLLCVKTAQNLKDSGLAKEFFIPYLDNFVQKVQLDEKKILVKNAKAILQSS